MSVFHLLPGPDRDLRRDQRGLIRISDGGMATLNAAGGLPCDSVHRSMPDDAGSVWLYMPCGLVRLRQQDLDVWTERIADGQAPGVRVPFIAFDSVDGVRPPSEPTHDQLQVTKAWDGGIGFATLDGVAVIDPRRIRANTIPPPVHIGVRRGPLDLIRFQTCACAARPRSADRLQSLSLAAPEKNRFRIKLEGRDADWQDVGTRRQAFNTDLGLRDRFRVAGSKIAASGTRQGRHWNSRSRRWTTRRAGSRHSWPSARSPSSAWPISPASVRPREDQWCLDERVTERTRIARELHDTLLQSFHGCSYASRRVISIARAPGRSEGETGPDAIAHAAKAITEGRDAVQGLRASTLERNDLANAIRTHGDELAANAK